MIQKRFTMSASRRASRSKKPGLTERLEAVVTDRSLTGNTPGGPSRWSNKRSSEWVPVKPKLVVEVFYDHFTGGRFRHGTKLLRWRPDKNPRQCTMLQLQQKVSHRSTSSGVVRIGRHRLEVDRLDDLIGRGGQETEQLVFMFAIPQARHNFPRRPKPRKDHARPVVVAGDKALGNA